MERIKWVRVHPEVDEWEAAGPGWLAVVWRAIGSEWHASIEFDHDHDRDVSCLSPSWARSWPWPLRGGTDGPSAQACKAWVRRTLLATEKPWGWGQ